MRGFKNILLFVFVFIASYYAIYFLMFNITFNNKLLIQEMQEKVILEKDILGKTLKEFDTNYTYDIVFLGSSHCYRSFNPSIFEKHNISSYNLGSAGQTPINSYSLLQKFIKNAQTFVLEVYPAVSGISGEESFLSMNASIDDYDLLLKSALHLNQLRCYNAITIKPFIDSWNKNKEVNLIHSYKGYEERVDSLKETIEYPTIKMNQEHMLKQLDYIRKMLLLCKKNNKEIILVYAPIPQGWVIDGEEQFINKIIALVKENNSLFLNFGRSHSYSSVNHFYDRDHLNKSGVQLFNEDLIRLIQSNRSN